MRAVLVMIEARIAAADKYGLKATARWWREHHAVIAARLAAETDNKAHSTG